MIQEFGGGGGAAVEDQIVNGVIDKAPSQNAVFDALALKANIAAPTFTGDARAVTATAGDTSLSGGDGDDTFTLTTTLTVADTITGGAGNDTLNITADVDVDATELDTVTGVETIVYGDSTASSVVTFAFTITNSSAFDADTTTVSIQPTSATEDDTLEFSATNLTRGISVTGAAGVDTITGGAGADTINGGGGSDASLVGGAGAGPV
jgi:Ca2+-binding RTX toxin-like protein